MKIKRWLIVLAVVIVALWLSGGLMHRYVPGQEENPALAKASLCGVASDAHAAFINATREDGMVTKSGKNAAGIYVFEVDEAAWSEFPIESKEVLAIAGWCQAVSPDGRGAAVVIGATNRSELASVVDGEFRATAR